MSAVSARPQQGNFVRVRSRLYLVDQVDDAAERAPDEDTIVHLSCLDEDAQGARLSVLWQSEVDARIVDAQSFRSVATRGLDDPRTFAAYLHAQRWNCVTSTRPRLFQAPHRAGIELLTYSSSRSARRCSSRGSTSSSPTTWASARPSRPGSSSASS
jgi:hypothetical protein